MKFSSYHFSKLNTCHCMLRSTPNVINMRSIERSKMLKWKLHTLISIKDPYAISLFLSFITNNLSTYVYIEPWLILVLVWLVTGWGKDVQCNWNITFWLLRSQVVTSLFNSSCFGEVDIETIQSQNIKRKSTEANTTHTHTNTQHFNGQ